MTKLKRRPGTPVGWYAMYRGWADHPIFAPEPYSEREAWECLISSAVFDPDGYKIYPNGKPQYVMRGQLSFSIRFLATKWKWDKNRVHRFLRKLEKDQMIRTEIGTSQFVITISNYEKYQFQPKEGETVDETL